MNPSWHDWDKVNISEILGKADALPKFLDTLILSGGADYAQPLALPHLNFSWILNSDWNSRIILNYFIYDPELLKNHTVTWFSDLNSNQKSIIVNNSKVICCDGMYSYQNSTVLYFLDQIFSVFWKIYTELALKSIHFESGQLGLAWKGLVKVPCLHKVKIVQTLKNEWISQKLLFFFLFKILLSRSTAIWLLDVQIWIRLFQPWIFFFCIFE